MFIKARFLLLMFALAFGLTLLFWWPLYRGAGFIGGDLYPYFFPQKAFYADCLKRNEFPLWNDLAGFGYPVLGESQTGAAYPFHLIFYWGLDLNTAYNLEHLLHYVICFVATALFAQRLGLKLAGSALTALVFTYGWFPPRACLEWAIVTGAWLPVALYFAESFLQTRWWRYAIGLSVTLGMQLLAGHFHLAFITQLLVVTYVSFRLWTERNQPIGEIDQSIPHCRRQATIGLMLAVAAGICLASVQLLPAWELKQRSSRVVSSSDYDPAYGHMPPLYASQMIAPWCWYNPLAITEENIVRDLAELVAPWHWFGTHHDLDQAIQQSRFGALTNGTNKVEAHVYCGLVPTLMAMFFVATWIATMFLKGKTGSSAIEIKGTTGFWLIAGLFAMVYATGWLLPIGRHLPGFSFFRGPGRYGIVTTLAIALFAGQLLTQIAHQRRSRIARLLILAFVFGSTCGDLWLVSRMVRYHEMITRPAISYRDESLVRQQLLAEKELPRLLAPGPNVGNLLGVSCVPWYLGIAPAEYVDPQFAMPALPKPQLNGTPTGCSDQLLDWLSRSGVTHVLNFEPLDEKAWQVELMWKGIDPFLNRVWGRPEPIHLYRFVSDPVKGPAFPGRASTDEGRTAVQASQGNMTASRICNIDTGTGPSGRLVLTELAYPGWTVTRNGEDWTSRQTGLFREVEYPVAGGEFVWNYRPQSVFYGAAISLATIVMLAAVGHVRFWHPELLRWKK